MFSYTERPECGTVVALEDTSFLKGSAQNNRRAEVSDGLQVKLITQIFHQA